MPRTRSNVKGRLSGEHGVGGAAESTLASALVRVTDAFGAELRILLRTITAVCKSSEAQRQRERNFREARRSEERRDRTWDDDWW